MTTKNNYFGEPISTYSGKQAIEDGFLVDVSETAREAGFRWPVALTPQVWEDVQAIPKSQRHQDVQGRLWDLLRMLLFRIKLAKQVGDVVNYVLIMHVGRKTNYYAKAEITFYDEDTPMIVIKRQ